MNQKNRDSGMGGNILFFGVLWLALGVVFTAMAGPSAAAKKQIHTEIKLAFNQLVDASKHRDSQAYMGLIDTDRFVGINADGTAWQNADALKSLINASFAANYTVESLEFGVVHISVIDNNTALLVNEYAQTMRFENGQKHTFAGAGTQVWSKVTGSWKLVSISASDKSE